MCRFKYGGANRFKTVFVLIIIGILATSSGCISWNVQTTLESNFLPDGTLERSGIISIKQFDKDSEDKRVPVALDTLEAKTYIDKNYIPPEGVLFKGYSQNPDSSLSVNWSLMIDRSVEGLSD